jgi:uncharacterized membrane protein YgdD (TMEM256/DUF423 family)
MNRQIIITASILGLLAVITGAFGAHGLKDLLPAQELDVWKTAVQYQFYHALAMLLLAVLGSQDKMNVKASYYFFLFGVILFSGSLYLLSCRAILGWGLLAAVGIITPIGGLLFILGWLFLFINALKVKNA